MKKVFKVLAAVFAASIMFGFAGCKNETEDDTVAVEKVEITAEATEVVVDSTIKLTAAVSPDNATNKTVTWSSSAEDIATVDSNGVVKGVAAGTATITATVGEKKDSVEITVNAKKTESSTDSGAETGDKTSSGSSESGDQTGGDTEKGDGSQESGGDTEKGDTSSGESGESGEEGGSTGGESGGQTETVAVTEVKITSTVTEVTADDSITLEVSVSPDNASDKTVTWSSDNEKVATVDSNGVVKGVAAGKATINATVGEKRDSVEITVNRKVVVGDIILQDLTIVSSEGYTKNESNPAVAVVAGFNKDDAVIGLGLQSGSKLGWAKSGTTGYNTNFTNIIAKYSGSTSSGYTFTDDCDGSNNWDYICSIDKEGTDTAEEIAGNYPAFNFALNYGTNQGYTGDLASGWYIPSISELYEIYKNKETLQTSLTKVSGFTIGTSYYWSSSQSSNYSNDACDLKFKDGTVEVSSKVSGLVVLVVRAF